MANVRLLPDHVANQIAAGEVIERPASVIKELVENSIDAGATRIEVEFRNGGSSLMRIEDNGCGMSQDDALLSLERHATSKIRNAKDLSGLTTMGFRGEALPSIASVSRFQMQTREADAEGGTEIVVDGGKLLHVRDCGMPQGTRTTISKLFSTVPARRKFLKSVTTESAHIVQCVRLYALAHPEIGFSLIDDGRVLFQSPACESLQVRIAEIFGKNLAKDLIAISAKEEGMGLSGLIGKPSLSRSSRHEMLFFVNNRPVENKTLSYALVESYYGHMPKGRYPVAFLFLDIDPARVDVNVHPAKREIRFREEAKTRGFAVRSLLEALRAETDSYRDLKPVAVRPPPKAERSDRDDPSVAKSHAIAPAKPESTEPKARRRLVESEPSAEEPSKVASVPEKVARIPEAASVPLSRKESAVAKSVESEAVEPVRNRQSWNYLGWAQDELAVFDTGKGLTLLSLRAARQRILYEQLIQDFEGKVSRCQKLLLPQPLELDPLSAASLVDNDSLFTAMGFEINPFGRNFFRIEGSPTWISDGEVENFVKDALALLRQGSLSGGKSSVAIELLAKKAAQSIRNKREEPSVSEIEGVLDRLFACQKPLTDPEGRPTLIELGRGEIDRRFHRRSTKGQADLL